MKKAGPEGRLFSFNGWIGSAMNQLLRSITTNSTRRFC